MCPDNVPTPAMNASIAAGASGLTAILAGGDIPSGGDDVVNAVFEHCDGSDLDRMTTATAVYVNTQRASACHGARRGGGGLTASPVPSDRSTATSFRAQRGALTMAESDTL